MLTLQWGFDAQATLYVAREFWPSNEELFVHSTLFPTVIAICAQPPEHAHTPPTPTTHFC